jgi:hypothetical protein
MCYIQLPVHPQILWKVGADYDYIDADIMDWQQLKNIITDRFVPIKAVAPMVEHIILPLQEVSPFQADVLAELDWQCIGCSQSSAAAWHRLRFVNQGSSANGRAHDPAPAGGGHTAGR